MNWDEHFISMVYLVSMKSKDPSSKIGAVIVGPDNEIRSTGYNGLPRGLKDGLAEREARPEKYFWYEHGERNAVYNAARMGTPTDGCTMYTQGVPCADCARAVIQAGITKVIVDARYDADVRAVSDKLWSESCGRAKNMLLEAGVEVIEYTGPITTTITGLRGGKPLDLGKKL